MLADGEGVGVGGDVGDELALGGVVGGEGEDGFDFGVEGEGAGRVEGDGGAGVVELEGALLEVGEGFGYAVGVADEEAGGIDEDGSVGVFGLDFEAVEDGLGEGLADGELFGCVGGRGAEGLIGLDEEDLGAGALKANDDSFGNLAAIEAEVVGAGAVGEGVGVEEVLAVAVGVKVRDLEVELAGFGVPVEGQEAIDALHTGGFAGDGRGRRLSCEESRERGRQKQEAEGQTCAHPSVVARRTLRFACCLPGFGVLPADVGGVVEVQQEAFAAVEEAEAEDVVPEEGEGGGRRGRSSRRRATERLVRALGDEEVGAEGAVAVHVLEVALEVGVGVVDDVVVEGLELAVEGDGLVDGTLGEAGGGGEVGGVAAEEAELGVGVEAAVANPAVEEEIAAADEVGVGRRGWWGGAVRISSLELGGELFVGVEREDPGAGAFFDGGVLLGGEALPGLGEDFGVEGGGDLEGAVGGTGVDDDDFVGEVDAGEGAGEVLLFVEGDDGYGQWWTCMSGRAFLVG